MHVIVDGSNLATEGRVLPSLAQLSQAVIDFKAEHPAAAITVIVDATFGHRIDANERPAYEEGIVHQELVAPPAGAVGRGDAFVLRIAQKVGGVVLSNDSFQEFHAEHPWLFDDGRLVGGKPVPGVGWVFTPRTPVRGPKSREATKGKRKRGGGGAKATVTAEAPLISASELLEKGRAALEKLPAKKGKAKQEAAQLKEAIAKATEEAEHPATARAAATNGDGRTKGDGDGKKGRKRRRKGGGGPPSEPVNEPRPFALFVATYRPGDPVMGTVEVFSSHGAFVHVGDARCYIPLTLMGDPPPRAARDVLQKGEQREFVVRAFDTARRGIELMMPGVAEPVGTVSEETVAAETGADPIEDQGIEPKPKKAAKKPANKVGKKSAKKAKPSVDVEPVAPAAPPAKAAAKKKVPAKRVAAKKVAAKKVAETAEVASTKPFAKKAPAKKAPAKRAPAKKAPAKKAAANRAPVKNGAVKQAPVTKAAVTKAAVTKATLKTATLKTAPAAPKSAAKKASAKAAAVKRVPAKP